MSDCVDILVCGGGAIGLASAIFFKQYGYDIRIVDRLDKHLEWGKSHVMLPRTMEILDRLGVTDTITSISFKIRYNVNYENGNRLSSVLSTTHPSCTYNQAYSIKSQYVLEKILEERLENELGQSVERQTEVIAFNITDEEDEYPVEVVIQKGERKSTVRCKYLVGADGARSFIRKQMPVAFEEIIKCSEPIDYAYLDIDGSTDLPDAGNICLLNYSEGTVLYVPKPDGLIKVSYHLNNTNASHPLDRSASEDEILERIRSSLIPYKLHINKVQSFFTWSVLERLVDKFDYDNRIFLVGDAAHIQSPLTNQGLNLGFSDAQNLAWKIHLIEQGIMDRSVLNTYSQERRHVCEDVIKSASEFTKIAAGLRVEGHRPGINSSMMKEIMYKIHRNLPLNMGIGVEYPMNILNNEDLTMSIPPIKLNAGKRSADAFIKKCGSDHEMRLFHLYSLSAFSILIFTGDLSSSTNIEKLRYIDQFLSSDDSFVARYKGVNGSSLFKIILLAPSQNQELLGNTGLDGDLEFMKPSGVYIDSHDTAYSCFRTSDDGDLNLRGGLVIVRPDDYIAGILELDEIAYINEYFANFLI